MEIVETKMLVACRGPTILQMNTLFPRGKYLVMISIKVRGITTVHNSRSETAKFKMNMFLGVRIAGLRITATI
jgi:hypothetical protein